MDFISVRKGCMRLHFQLADSTRCSDLLFARNSYLRTLCAAVQTQQRDRKPDTSIRAEEISLSTRAVNFGSRSNNCACRCPKRLYSEDFPHTTCVIVHGGQVRLGVHEVKFRITAISQIRELASAFVKRMLEHTNKLVSKYPNDAPEDGELSHRPNDGNFPSFVT
jgi:hypothetical protein